MRILFLNPLPQEPIDQVYLLDPELAYHPYASQLHRLYELGVGRSDFFPRQLAALGVEVDQIVPNVFPLQSRWAQEKGMRLSIHARRDTYREWRRFHERFFFRLLRRLNAEPVEEDWKTQVVAAQVESYDPDVIVNGDLRQFPSSFLERIKGKKRFLVGESAGTVPGDIDMRPYDLLLSGSPRYVERSRGSGVPAELFRRAFDPSILDRLETGRRGTSVVFVGSLRGEYRRRLQWLETVAREVQVRVWCRGVELISPESPLNPRVQGLTWGYDRYQQVSRAAITLDFPGDGIDADAAGSFRLFEGTGLGTLVVTEARKDLSELFEPGKEVVACSTAEECAERVRYYFDNPKEARLIAKAGQERTLAQHTYRQRAEQFLAVLNERLGAPAATAPQTQAG